MTVISPQFFVDCIYLGLLNRDVNNYVTVSSDKKTGIYSSRFLEEVLLYIMGRGSLYAHACARAVST